MRWRVGDKVRLVGEKWFTYPCPRERGTVHEITKVHGRDRVQLEGDTAPWDMTWGWEIELVERKEENMIDISDVNVGDRVKLTRENGDEATFTVDLKVPSHGVIGSAVNRFLDKDWDTLEIVERPEPPFEPYWGMVIGERHEHHNDGGVKAVYVPTGDGQNWFSHPEPEGKKGIYYFDDDWAKRKLAEGWVVIEKPEGVK